MSYDTTVDDAIDPPHPRVPSPPERGATPFARTRFRWVGRWLLVTSLVLAVLLLVPWIVAAFTSPDAEAPVESPGAPGVGIESPATSVSLSE